MRQWGRQRETVTKNTRIEPQASNRTASHLRSLIYQLQYSYMVERIIDPPLVGDRKEKRAVLKIDVVIVVPDEPRDLAVAADRREALHAQQSKLLSGRDGE